jgi:hypothetical protein
LPLTPPRQDNPEQESARRQLHVLAHVEGHEGPTLLRCKTLVDDASQAGSKDGLER